MILTRAVAALAVVAAGAFVLSTAPVALGHAAGVPVTSGRLSTFRPTTLPPVCTSQTVVAAADTWVNEQSSKTNYSTSASLTVQARNSQNARTLLHFTLPTTPAGCTLTSATLRLNNTSAATGRTVQVFRAGAAWTDSAVTWATMPAPAGTAVDAAAAVGWMQWTVTAHVQAMYTGSNNGFIVRDSSETGNTIFTQSFDSMDGTNKPQLVLQWG
jgi:hypothetical protein